MGRAVSWPHILESSAMQDTRPRGSVILLAGARFDFKFAVSYLEVGICWVFLAAGIRLSVEVSPESAVKAHSAQGYSKRREPTKPYDSQGSELSMSVLRIHEK